MNTIALEKNMLDCRIKDIQLIKALQISPSAYYRKKRGETEFTRPEIQTMISELMLNSAETMDIFFSD